MKIYNSKSMQESTENCCVNTKIKELTAKETGDKALNIKFFKMNSEGYSPLHKHLQQHRLIVTAGKGTIFDGEKMTAIQAGDVIYIMPNEPHQLKTAGKKPLKFTCLTI
jgi:quercetin dioxygenase-like cupin family protein